MSRSLLVRYGYMRGTGSSLNPHEPLFSSFLLSCRYLKLIGKVVFGALLVRRITTTWMVACYSFRAHILRDSKLAVGRSSSVHHKYSSNLSSNMIPSKEVVQRPKKVGIRVSASSAPPPQQAAGKSQGKYCMKSKNGYLIPSTTTVAPSSRPRTVAPVPVHATAKNKANNNNNNNNGGQRIVILQGNGNQLQKVYDSKPPPASSPTRAALQGDEGIRVKGGGGGKRRSADASTVVSLPHQRHGVKQNGGNYRLRAEHGRLRGAKNCSSLR